jgi:hypothetical protein
MVEDGTLLIAMTAKDRGPEMTDATDGKRALYLSNAAVVAEYLKNAFPGYSVLDSEDQSTVSWFYRLEEGTEFRHSLHVSRAVLVDHDAAALGALLLRWNLGARIRGAGTRRVLVTGDGISIPGGRI